MEAPVDLGRHERVDGTRQLLRVGLELHGAAARHGDGTVDDKIHFGVAVFDAPAAVRAFENSVTIGSGVHCLW